MNLIEKIKRADSSLLAASCVVLMAMVAVLAGFDFSLEQRAEVTIVGVLAGLSLWMTAFVGSGDQARDYPIVEMHARNYENLVLARNEMGAALSHLTSVAEARIQQSAGAALPSELRADHELEAAIGAADSVLRRHGEHQAFILVDVGKERNQLKNRPNATIRPAWWDFVGMALVGDKRLLIAVPAMYLLGRGLDTLLQGFEDDLAKQILSFFQ